MKKAMKWAKRLAIAASAYLFLDGLYVAKCEEGIDLLPPSYGHHGWMFAGSDWAVAKIDRARQKGYFSKLHRIRL